MIQFGAELEGVGKSLQDMIERIDHLGRQDVPDELVFWQTEDMRRQRPNTETPNDKTAQTMIWQKSNVARTKKGRRRRRRKVRRLKPYDPTRADKKPRKARRSRGSPLPRIGGVLRIELFTELMERMGKLMREKLKW
jgi:hypothetical protein